MRGFYWRLYKLQYVEEKLQSQAPIVNNQNLKLESGSVG
jgi:hypothetical protein